MFLVSWLPNSIVFIGSVFLVSVFQIRLPSLVRCFAVARMVAMTARWGMVAPLVLIVIAVLYRVILGIAGSDDVNGFHNFAPVSAIALCGALYLPRRMALLVPLGILFVSDLVLNVFHYGVPLWTWEIVPRYLALILIVLLGWRLRTNARFAFILGASVAASVVFFVITNTGSWLAEPSYAKTFGGWIQAMTTGVPGWPSTWWFYRQTFISDLLFTTLFFACMQITRRAVPQFGRDVAFANQPER